MRLGQGALRVTQCSFMHACCLWAMLPDGSATCNRYSEGHYQSQHEPDPRVGMRS